uniref:tRNA (adenine(58)-N(1))-methyltransferase n=1 Tax=Pogona vitticeps TaxID=103695 RepID=A0A6J0TRJ0_9SAUR
MLQGWRRWAGLQGWRQGWAAIRRAAKETPLVPGSGRSKISLGAAVAGNRRWHRHHDDRQGRPCPGRSDPALPAAGGPHDFQHRRFSSSAGDEDGRDNPKEKADDVAPRPLELGRLMGRKRAWERSLSPLERLSRMVPEEFHSPEVRALRNTEAQESQEEDEKEAYRTGDGSFPASPRFLSQTETQLGQVSGSEEVPAGPSSKNFPFQVGDLILAEIWRKHNIKFKKLCKLTNSGTLQSPWGVINFADIKGKFPGEMLQTSTGALILIRRPSLEEFVLLMKRGPAITYPKDISAMLLLMDISQGDIVLEAGSGSGAMTLFLSRAVGPQGHVRSYEVRKDHHKLAMKNYQTWRNAWKIGHTVKWPHNVNFIDKDIVTAAEELKTIVFDVVFLDMVNPLKALPTIFPSLKQGGVCTVYFANVTQVVELLEAIRTKQLAFFCEKVLEATHRDWLILPATWKHGGIFKGKESQQNTDNSSACHSESDETAMEEQDDESFISDSAKVHYIAKPHPWQIGHTGFLVKLRKFNPADPRPDPNGAC